MTDKELKEEVEAILDSLLKHFAPQDYLAGNELSEATDQILRLMEQHQKSFYDKGWNGAMLEAAKIVIKTHLKENI